MWASLNTAVARVSSGGVATRVSAGTVLISATCEGISGTASVTYRFEHAIERVSATQFRMHAHIYDVNGALLHDTDDFRSNDNTTSLAGTLARVGFG